VRIYRTKAEMAQRLSELNEQLSERNREAAVTDVLIRDLRTQVRNLTGQKDMLESRSSNAGRNIGEMRRQRSEALQAVARIVSMLAETPENIRLSPPSAPKDEAPF
jgi:chromosome segregation ATPase